MSLSVRPRREDHVLIVPVVEDSCADLWTQIEPELDASCRVVVLDFSQVHYLNSMNIAAIISLRNKLLAKDLGMLLGAVPANIQAVFRILKLERLFNLDLDLDQALEAARSC